MNSRKTAIRSSIFEFAFRLHCLVRASHRFTVALFTCAFRFVGIWNEWCVNSCRIAARNGSQYIVTDIKEGYRVCGAPYIRPNSKRSISIHAFIGEATKRPPHSMRALLCVVINVCRKVKSKCSYLYRWIQSSTHVIHSLSVVYRISLSRRIDVSSFVNAFPARTAVWVSWKHIHTQSIQYHWCHFYSWATNSNNVFAVQACVMTLSLEISYSQKRIKGWFGSSNSHSFIR